VDVVNVTRIITSTRNQRLKVDLKVQVLQPIGLTIGCDSIELSPDPFLSEHSHKLSYKGVHDS
jgi:hypothetical protein